MKCQNTNFWEQHLRRGAQFGGAPVGAVGGSSCPKGRGVIWGMRDERSARQTKINTGVHSACPISDVNCSKWELVRGLALMCSVNKCWILEKAFVQHLLCVRLFTVVLLSGGPSALIKTSRGWGIQCPDLGASGALGVMCEADAFGKIRGWILCQLLTRQMGRLSGRVLLLSGTKGQRLNNLPPDRCSEELIKKLTRTQDLR